MKCDYCGEEAGHLLRDVQDHLMGCKVLYARRFEKEEGTRDFIRMKRVPKNLDESFPILASELGANLEKFKNLKEERLTGETHFTLGQWIRNEWGLWDEEGELHKWFLKELGIFHADDMSGIIITSFHRKLNGKPVDLKKQVKFYKDFWAKEK